MSRFPIDPALGEENRRYAGMLLPWRLAEFFAALYYHPHPPPVPLEALWPNLALSRARARLADAPDEQDFARAAREVRHLAVLEELVGIASLAPSAAATTKARIQAIREWAEVLRLWPVRERGGRLPQGAKRFDPMRGLHTIARENVEALNGFLQTGDYPRINALRAGVIAPGRRSTRSPDAPVTLVDWRVAVAGAFAQRRGGAATTAWEETLPIRRFFDGYETGTGPCLTSVVGTGGVPPQTARGRVANSIAKALVGRNGRYAYAPEPIVRLALVGELRRVPSARALEAAQAEGTLSAADAARVVGEIAAQRVASVGFLIFARFPADPVAGDGRDPQASALQGFNVVDDLQEIFGRWMAAPDRAPVRVLELAPRHRDARRIDAAVDADGTPVHVWIEEVVDPAAWGPALIFHTGPDRFVRRLAFDALRSGLLLGPEGLVALSSPEGSPSYTRIGHPRTRDVTAPPAGDRYAEWVAPEEKLILEHLAPVLTGDDAERHRWAPVMRRGPDG